MDRHARTLIPLKSPWPIALFLVALAALVYGLTRPDSKTPAVPNEKISRRHPSPPSDLQALNQSTGQDISRSVLYRMDGQVTPWSSLPKEKPVVLVFFSHDCDCSLEFAKYFAVAMEKAKTKTSWFFLFAETPDQIHEFMTKTGTNLPVLRDPNSQLGHRLGITKSGCFILVQPDGLVSAIWPGTSLAGLNDLFSRLHLPPLSPDLPGLSGIPQAPTAGCPLQP
jgi:peroxiredoxin